MNQQRQKILEFLQEHARQLAPLYNGAVLMLESQDFAGRERFIAHAAREICNRLPSYLRGGERRERIEYESELDKIAKVWPAMSIEGRPISAKIELDVAVFSRLDSLVSRNSDRDKRKDIAYSLFELVSPDNSRARSDLAPVVGQWMKLTTWFVKFAHDHGPNGHYPAFAEVEEKFTTLEASLMSLMDIFLFFDLVGEIDEILEDANS